MTGESICPGCDHYQKNRRGRCRHLLTRSAYSAPMLEWVYWCKEFPDERASLKPWHILACVKREPKVDVSHTSWTR